MKPRSECHCSCHRNKKIKHIIACCYPGDKPPLKLWKKVSALRFMSYASSDAPHWKNRAVVEAIAKEINVPFEELWSIANENDN